MADRYTKIVLTVIAISLVWLGVRPIVTPQAARAAADTVRIEGVVKVEAESAFGLKVQPPAFGFDVRCVSGCSSN